MPPAPPEVVEQLTRMWYAASHMTGDVTFTQDFELPDAIFTLSLAIKHATKPDIEITIAERNAKHAEEIARCPYAESYHKTHRYCPNCHWMLVE